MRNFVFRDLILLLNNTPPILRFSITDICHTYFAAPIFKLQNSNNEDEFDDDDEDDGPQDVPQEGVGKSEEWDEVDAVEGNDVKEGLLLYDFAGNGGRE